MAQTQDLRFISTLFANTLDLRSKKTFDQVHARIPFTWYLMNSPESRGVNMGMGKGVVPYRGGGKIRITIGNTLNPNFKWYDRHENMSVATTDEQTDGFDVMRNASATVGISGPELDDNRGELQIRDMLREKVSVMERTFKQQYEAALVQGVVGTTGSGTANRRLQPVSKGPNCLGYLIQKEGSLTGAGSNADLIHEINQGTETSWRNNAQISSATTFEDFFRELQSMYHLCGENADSELPDFGICDRFLYEAIQAMLFDKQRFLPFGSSSASGESPGFPSVRFMDMVIFWSGMVPNLGTLTTDAVSLTQSSTQGVLFFLNSSALKLYVSDRRNMTASAFIEPYDQDAIYGKLLSRCQLITNERRKLGVLYDVPSATLAPAP